MPSFVISDKCDGCKGGDKTACMYICPNDLMVLDPDEMKAYNQEPINVGNVSHASRYVPPRQLK